MLYEITSLFEKLNRFILMKEKEVWMIKSTQYIVSLVMFLPFN